MSNVIKLTPLGKAVGGGQKSAPNYLPSDLQLQLEKDAKSLNKQIKYLRKKGGQTDLSELKYLNKILRKLIPLAANQFAVFKNDRAALSLKILLEQKREVIQDIRALDSGPKHIKFITDRVLSPSIQAMLQNYLSDCYEQRKNIRKIKEPKLKKTMLKNLDRSMQDFGKFLNAVQSGAEEKLVDYFGGKF